MLSVFFDYLNSKMPITEEEEALLTELLPVRVCKKGEYLLREGEVCNSFYFNLQGLARLYYNTDGVDVTAFFYTEGLFISVYESYLSGKPAAQNIQAVENLTVIEIHRDSATELLMRIPKLSHLAMAAMEEELIAHQRIIALLLTQSPERRYQQLLDEYGDYFKRIPQRYLASFIGVKPESFSRIKKRIAEATKNIT